MRRVFALVLFSIAPLFAAEKILINVEVAPDPKFFSAWDAKAQPARGDKGAVLQVNSGNREAWPGLTFKAPEKVWDISAHAVVETEVHNTGATDLKIGLRVDNEGSDGTWKACVATQLFKPGERGPLRVEIQRGGPYANEKIIGVKAPPALAGLQAGQIDPARVTQIIVFLPQPKQPHQFTLSPIRATGDAPPAVARTLKSFFPLIDTFGQYMHAEWPGKTMSLDALQSRADADRAFARVPMFKGWNKWGGWQDGPQLQASGFFRAEKVEGKWWLVDPDGRLFWSHGVCCVTFKSSTPTEERKNWFADFPGDAPEFKPFVHKAEQVVHGHYKWRKPECFDFVRANLFRKYGPDFAKEILDITHGRFGVWGLNTIANWSDEELCQQKRTPYTAVTHYWSKPIAGSEGYWGQFVDVFDPNFAVAVRKELDKHIGKAANDPWCLGFFVDNELAWGDETTLALATLKSPADQPAKRAFIDDLKKKYETIEKLNAAWNTKHASWEALLSNKIAPDVKAARADLEAFTTHLAETYFSTCRDAVKAIAPNQLYLGCRFAWVNPLTARAAAKYCDVIAYNLYRKTVADFKPVADKPHLVTEFHFGATDRGVFHPGLVPVKDQAERADAYRSFVRGALTHPNFVGTHWFQYQDQPTSGRSLDEENFQIGLIDIADRPYPETIQAVTEIAKEMYKLRSGK